MKKWLGLALLCASGATHAYMGTISFYGDSFVYRSGWQCEGQNLSPEQCSALKADSSFATHVPYPYSWTTEPVFDLVHVAGKGGDTCLSWSGGPGLSSRLQYRGERRIAVLIGINDVNLAGHTVENTATCITGVWQKIADEYGAQPVAILYPPIAGSTTVWPVSGTVAAQRRDALNSAILAAARRFNEGRAPGQPLVHVASFANAYDPTPGTYTTDGVHPTPTGALQLARYFYWAFH